MPLTTEQDTQPIGTVEMQVADASGRCTKASPSEGGSS